MEIEEYLFENESITEQVSAYDSIDALSSANEGTLACTPVRLVYVCGNDVTDISINDVHAIEYGDLSYPTEYLNWGLGTMILGLILLTIWGVVEYIFSELGFETLLFFVSGVVLSSAIVILLWGYFVRRATLKIHTSNKSYEFTSEQNNLDEIAHTVRAYEMKNNQYGAY